MAKEFRTNCVRLKFNEYQNAYWTVVAKNYTFCLNLMTEWLYHFLKGLHGKARKKYLDKIDQEVRRNTYNTLIHLGFPAKLYLTIYKRLPSLIAQNIWPEAKALATGRLEKPQKEYHFKIHSSYFTWTNVNKNQEVVLPRSKYLKQFFKDPVKMTIPDKVYQHIHEDCLKRNDKPKYYFRFRWVNGVWYLDIIKEIEVPNLKTLRKQDLRFAAIDINLSKIAFLDEVTQQPVIFSLERIWYNAEKEFKKYQKVCQKKDFQKARKHRQKIKHMFQEAFKLYAIRIVEWCHQHNITVIGIGNVKPTIPRNELNREMRRLWNMVPWTYFKEYLEFYARRFGIRVWHVNEAYTSKADAINQDPLPRNKTEFKQLGITFSGKRIVRGLYKTFVDGKEVIIHADINACANMLRRLSIDHRSYDIKFNYKKLSAVRRVSNVILSWTSLKIALFFKRLKDFSPIEALGSIWGQVKRAVTAVLQSVFIQRYVHVFHSIPMFYTV